MDFSSAFRGKPTSTARTRSQFARAPVDRGAVLAKDILLRTRPRLIEPRAEVHWVRYGAPDIFRKSPTPLDPEKRGAHRDGRTLPGVSSPLLVAIRFSRAYPQGKQPIHQTQNLNFQSDRSLDRDESECLCAQSLKIEWMQFGAPMILSAHANASRRPPVQHCVGKARRTSEFCYPPDDGMTVPDLVVSLLKCHFIQSRPKVTAVKPNRDLAQQFRRKNAVMAARHTVHFPHPIFIHGFSAIVFDQFSDRS